MRDINRIDKFCKRLAKAWKMFSDPRWEGEKQASMKRMIASRGTGKSTELLRMALEDKNAAIAVPNANYIRMYCAIANGVLGIPIEKIHEIVNCAEIDGVLVAPFFDFINHPTCSAFNRRNVYIDELELCIKATMVYHNFVGYTLSIE